MSIFRSDDPSKDFDRWDAERENWLARRPICVRCNDPIQGQKLWDINGDLYCRYCARDEFEKYTEDYIL